MRKIIHIDMDAFFAAVEQRDRPELRGKPVVVGGDPFGRGVVSTASYEARKYGIRSAMPAAQAKKLCPNAIFLRPNFQKYSEVSATVMNILRKHTDLVEPVSVDEAYLDVTRHRFGVDDAVLVAKLLKQNIHAVTRLTASAGVAPNMFLAKVASDMQKPDGLTVVHPQNVQTFLKDLPVRKIPGVGPVTETALHKLGIRICSELATCEVSFLQEKFGKTGIYLSARARGIDDRQVEPNWEAKQYSSEETFDRDTKDVGELKERLREYSEQVYSGLKESGRMGRTIVLKVKYHDFELITRSRTLPRDPSGWEEVYQVAARLLTEKTLAGTKPVRLLGVGISGLKNISESASGSPEPDLFAFQN